MKYEAMAALSSAVIALCALGFTGWQALIARKHNRLSVKPHITSWTESEYAKHKHSVYVLNNGIGPALIKSFEIFVDGQPMVGEGIEPILKALKVLFPQYQYRSYQSYFASGYMMAAKEVHALLTVEFLGDKVPQREEVEHALKRGNIIIKYESIYKEQAIFDASALRGPSNGC